MKSRPSFPRHRTRDARRGDRLADKPRSAENITCHPAGRASLWQSPLSPALLSSAETKLCEIFPFLERDDHFTGDPPEEDGEAQI